MCYQADCQGGQLGSVSPGTPKTVQRKLQSYPTRGEWELSYSSFHSFQLPVEGVPRAPSLPGTSLLWQSGLLGARPQLRARTPEWGLRRSHQRSRQWWGLRDMAELQECVLPKVSQCPQSLRKLDTALTEACTIQPGGSSLLTPQLMTSPSGSLTRRGKNVLSLLSQPIHLFSWFLL